MRDLPKTGRVRTTRRVGFPIVFPGWVCQYLTMLLKSSVIRRASWQSGTLTIEMVTGSTYRYLDVEDTEWLHLITAGSAGRYYCERIRGCYERG